MSDILRIAIIIPTLNEEGLIGSQLDLLQALRKDDVELIVVDGGSRDATYQLALPWVDQADRVSRGRAHQMNAGAAMTQADVLLFLHIDTSLPQNAIALIRAALASQEATWGRFDVVISGEGWPLHLIATMMNWRSRWTGIATGDQGLFIRRAEFIAVGGFPEQPLMEDIELSRRLRRRSPPVCLSQPVLTSGRRWQHAGVWRTVWLMWRLRFLYWVGVSPDRLAKDYQ